MIKTKKALISLGIKLGCIAVVLFVLFTFFITLRISHTNDMYPMIVDGDLVCIYKTSKISKDDVVLYTVNNEEHYGRVIATEGDVVEVNNSGVLINNNYRYETLPFKTERQGDLEYPITLKENEVFILGDLRDRAKDSRTYGVIHVDDIIGREFFLVRRRGF